MALAWSLPTGFETPITYFYVTYFAVLLIHRQMRDDEACEKKYVLCRLLERFPLTSESQVRQGLGKVQEACAVAHHPIRVLKNCHLRP